MKRILTALVMIPAVTLVIFQGPTWLFFATVALIAALCYIEYSSLVSAQGGEALVPMGLASGLVLLLAPEPFMAAALLALLGMAFAMRGDLQHSLVTAGGFALGLLYIFGAWRSAIELRALSPHWVFFACALNWAGDTAAMYVGKSIGKHKLAPQVSPGKTVEGAVGSMVASIVCGVLYLRWALPSVGWEAMVGLAMAGNVAGQVGDLAESALKRGAGVKDSGTLLPGHGGMLDRMDSSLFSMPVVLGLLRFIG